MATPNAGRPHSGSTPKNTSIATPASLMPSPRPPTSVPMARNLSHKSLASKTPASGPGQSHSVSTSSRPSNTPQFAPALGEDPLSFSSPAAMMMSSLASHGLTPLPSGPDGLAASGDLNNIPSGRGSALNSRNPEEEKASRLQEVLKLLETRVAGRGICRDGVERLAQQAGFTHMWQDDTLAIAGTCVDLEIAFDGVEKDEVVDVVLKIFTPEYEEHKENASEVLKSDLDSSLADNFQPPWKGLDRFAQNLIHLGKLDNLSQGINCFEAIEGLFLSFERIWSSEEESGHHHEILDHLSCGTVGRPTINRKPKLGLSLEYWSEKRQAPMAQSTIGDVDAMLLDSSPMERSCVEKQKTLWAARIDCESGYPSLRASKDWVAEDVFMEPDDGGKDSEVNNTMTQIAWIEPPPTFVTNIESTTQTEEVSADDSQRLPRSPEVRFVANLEPSVLVPLSVATSILHKQGLGVVLDNTKITTFDKALGGLIAQSGAAEEADIVQPPPKSLKLVTTYDSNGLPLSRQHLYRLYSMPTIWCCPLQSIAFDHPKHLADLFPTLRQYALLWTLLRSIVPSEALAATSQASGNPNRVASSDGEGSQDVSRRWNIKKSNINPRRAKIKALLKGGTGYPISRRISVSDPESAQEPGNALPIDISVGMTTSSPARPTLDLIWPVPATMKTRAAPGIPSFGGVCIEIAANGEIHVPSATSLPWAEPEPWLNAIAKIVALSEDLGLLVEWLMEKAYGNTG